MRIQKTKINKLESNLPPSLHNKDFIPSAILDTEKDKSKLLALGFSKDLQVGETLLPPAVGTASRFNSEGKLVVDKSKPKDTIYWDVEWTREQWAGRGETEEVTTTVTHSRKVWHKDLIPPPSVEITISKKEDGLVYITTPLVSFSDIDMAKHSINLMLDLFGFCDILSKDGVPVIKQRQRLNWQILPPGKRPWKEQRKFLKPLFDKIKSKNKVRVFEKRFERLDALNPDKTSIGMNGYQGYIIFHFEKKNIHVLESSIYGNALYIFNKDWKRLSQKTKAEIINSGQYVDRFTHQGEHVDIINKIKKLIQ